MSLSLSPVRCNNHQEIHEMAFENLPHLQSGRFVAWICIRSAIGTNRLLFPFSHGPCGWWDWMGSCHACAYAHLIVCWCSMPTKNPTLPPCGHRLTIWWMNFECDALSPKQNKCVRTNAAHRISSPTVLWIDARLLCCVCVYRFLLPLLCFLEPNPYDIKLNVSILWF